MVFSDNSEKRTIFERDDMFAVGHSTYTLVHFLLLIKKTCHFQGVLRRTLSGPREMGLQQSLSPAFYLPLLATNKVPLGHTFEK